MTEALTAKADGDSHRSMVGVVETRMRKARTLKKTARCMVGQKWRSLQEVPAESPKSLNDYSRRHRGFRDFCSENGHSTENAEDIDKTLEEWFDELSLMQLFNHRLRRGTSKGTLAQLALMKARRTAPLRCPVRRRTKIEKVQALLGRMPPLA